MTSHGRLDTKFSNNGIVRFEFSPGDVTWPIGIGIDASGTITAGLTGRNYTYGAVRVSPHGKLDDSYGNDGVLGIACNCFAFDADVKNGRVAITGPRLDGFTYQGAVVVRISRDGTSLIQGSVDPFPSNSSELAYDAAFSGGGKTVIAGTS
ncbi:MAG: hypothetical protein ABI586_07245 [Candidatus Nanopelagicales bacterium]